MAETLPTLVRKRDGRLVPFEADKISQSLYAATVALGQPSAFLARELTDGVLHFLPLDLPSDETSTEQIAELAAKVIRELGQPALAEIYWNLHSSRPQVSDTTAREKAATNEATFSFSSQDPPGMVARQCMRAYSLRAVFARDIAAAHEEGLLSLGGLEHPDELATMIADTKEVLAGCISLLRFPARTLVFDSPEYLLSEETAIPWLKILEDFCQQTGRQAIVNVRVSPPPPWANSAIQGPLFGESAGLSGGEGVGRIAELLFAEAARIEAKAVRVDSHRGEENLNPENAQRLKTLAQIVQAQPSRSAFVCDRSKRPVALAPGIDRDHAGALIGVTLDLPHFLSMPALGGDVARFLEKLPSLARMAVRAGVQKRNYLRGRRHDIPVLERGFLLERASLVVIPTGLDKVVQSLLGRSIWESDLSLDLGKKTMEALANALRRESQLTNLEICIEMPAGEFVVDAAGGKA